MTKEVKQNIDYWSKQDPEAKAESLRKQQVEREKKRK